jgi:hypothetical protein
MALHVDVTRFPIVLCRLDQRTDSQQLCTLATLEADCERYQEELQRHRGVFACVHDWMQAGDLSPEQWRLVFDRAVLNAALSSQCVAQAVAVGSPALRGFATSRTLQHVHPFALRVAASLESALAWCAWQLKRSEPQAV